MDKNKAERKVTEKHESNPEADNKYAEFYQQICIKYKIDGKGIPKTKTQYKKFTSSLNIYIYDYIDEKYELLTKDQLRKKVKEKAFPSKKAKGYELCGMLKNLSI